VAQPDMSYRQAADAVGGTSEATVRRRVKEIEKERGNASRTASPAIPMTPIPEPMTASTERVNGNTYATQEAR
jgi:hypothetical protein